MSSRSRYAIPPEIIGLDIETTGSDLNDHQIIQVGIVHAATGEEFKVDIRHENVWAAPGAFRVHGIPVETLDDPARLPPPQAGTEILKFFAGLRAGHAAGVKRFVPIGYNVGSFDLAFMFNVWPKLRYHISFQHIELNTLSFLWDTVGGLPLRSTKGYLKGAYDNKDSHDALADAREAVWSFKQYLGMVNNAEGSEEDKQEGE